MRNFFCKNLQVLDKSIFRLSSPCCFDISSEIHESYFNDLTLIANNSIPVTISKSTLRGNTRFRLDTDVFLTLRDIKIQEAIFSNYKTDELTNSIIHIDGLDRIGKPNSKSEGFFNSIVIFGCDFYLDFKNIILDNFLIRQNTRLKMLKFDNCMIANAAEHGADFRHLREFKFQKNCSITYDFFPASRKRWPEMKLKKISNPQDWMQSFIELRDQAVNAKRDDEKDLYIWFSQNFRLMASEDRITRAFLWMYNGSSSFGRNPFYPLLWWVFSFLIFLPLHTMILIWPCLGLSSPAFYDFFWKFEWFPKAASYSVYGMFPLIGVADQNLANTLVSSVHSIVSGILFFLTGFCIRNHTKL